MKIPPAPGVRKEGPSAPIVDRACPGREANPGSALGLPPAPSGCLVIPPFRDGHLHFFQDGAPLTVEQALSTLRAYARQGIFSLWDMGSRDGVGLRLKKVLGRMEDPPIRLKSAGYALHKKDRYGGFLGRGVEGQKEIREAVADVYQEGGDFLKVVHSGIVSLKNPGRITSGGFTREELRCLVEEARQYGLPVHCHVNSDPSIREAASLPISSIQHGFFISEETLHLLKEKRIQWTPTLYALDHFKNGLPPEQKAAMEKILDGHLDSLSRAAQLGVRLVVGTDSGSQGVSPGCSYLEELALFKKAGLSLEQILSAACLDPGEIGEGTYLVVKDDFIRAGKIEAAFRQGKAWSLKQGEAETAS
jgi:imidazolonepropionase-like amidohydrolase